MYKYNSIAENRRIERWLHWMETEDSFGSGADHLENSCIIIDTVLEHPILLGKCKYYDIW